MLLLYQMRIILATPLYPPETLDTATYVRELAKQMSRGNDITIVAYASVSEKINDAKLITVNKRKPLFFRLIEYFVAVFFASKNSDIIYAQNSIAVCFPALLVGFLRKISVIIRYEADEAQTRAERGNIGGIKILIAKELQKFVLRRAQAIITPYKKTRDAIINVYKIPEEKIAVISNPAKKEIFLPFHITKTPNQIISYDDNKTRAEMWYLYKTSQICVLEQDQENIEDILADCFNAGIPVIMADDKNFKEKVAELLKNSALREKIIQDNKKILEEKFSWQAHIAALLNLFKNISHCYQDFHISYII